MHAQFLLPIALSVLGAYGTGTNDQFGKNIDYGTFQNPSSNVRPRFRYWVNDASMNLTSIAEDIRDIGRSGAGGVELLGYYLYGDGQNFGGGLASPLQSDWTTYGFGSPAWKTVVDTVLSTAEQEGLIVDMGIGPNQGAGVPAPYNDDGLLWDLASFNSTFATGQAYTGVLPGWGSGTLVAAATGLVVNSTTSNSSTTKVLSEKSLTDVTKLVNSNGYLSYKPDKSSGGLEQVLFASYLVHSEYREVQSPAEVTVAVPQSPITSYTQNGSWAVDHFSAEGAQVVIDFWQKSLLDTETQTLIRQAGNYLWEDSQEYSVATFWTPRLQQVFQANRGYSVNKYIPLLVDSGGGSTMATTYLTDEADDGASHVVDYQQTLTELNAEYLKALTKWSNQINIQFSAQVVYNMPMDMLANIPLVNAPECETLGLSNNIDSYRQFSGPAHLAGKRVVSSEAGAEMLKVYQQTIPELLWSLKRSFAGSINQFVIHGYPTSGDYGNTTWPGFTTFAYLFSDMYGPRQPAFSFYSDFLNWISRNQYIGQTGIPKVDIAFWSKSTSYKTVPTGYSSEDLQEAGYTYEYLSPDNFALPEAYVSNGVFAPNRQAFKALVVQSSESLTTAGVAKLVEYAQNGLPVIFFGGLPSNYSGYNPKAANSAAASLDKIRSLKNVHIVSGGSLAATLQSLNISPRTSVSSNGTWYTYWRHDDATSTDYVYVYNDAPGLSFEQGFTVGNISLETTGVPSLYDAWTGDVTTISTYQQSSTHITIPLQLAANQSIIIAFHQGSQSGLHAQNTVDGIVSVEANGNSLAILRSYDEQTRSIKLSNGKSATLKPMANAAFTLDNWTLVVESWTPPTDMYNIAAGPQRTNSSYQLSTLISWNEVSSNLANVSGIGYYSTSFSWPPATNAGDSVSGAIIDLGLISHTARVTVNGQILPPVDLAWAKRDIGSLLKQGENIVEVVVSTTLGNVLRNYWDEIETSGKFATATMPAVPDEAAYGLLSPVKIVPYRKDQVS